METGIRATPAFDGQCLYVAGMRDVLVCLDAQTGKINWRLDFVKELNAPLPDFGFVSSPLWMGTRFTCRQEPVAPRSTNRMDKSSGARSATKVAMTEGAFSLPIFATLASKRQLVVQTRQKLAGLDPSDGTVLWQQQVEAFQGMNILTPVVYQDTLYTSTYGGKTIGFKFAQTSGKFSVRESWRQKSQGYMTTPVIIDGVAYTHLKSQRMMAIEVESGREYLDE